MKKILTYIVLLGLILSSCKKDEINHVFDKSPDERLEEQIGTYINSLTANKNGWLLTVNTKEAGGFNHWVSFNNANRAVMLSDVETFDDKFGPTATTKQESSYSVKALQSLVLSFDTYNYLHILTDPEGAVNGGKNGVGLDSDFEFSFLGENNGTYNLKGRYNKAKAILTPCTKEEAEAIQNGGLKKVQDDLTTYRKKMRYPAIEYGKIKANVDFSSRNVTLGYINPKDEAIEATVGAYAGLQSAIGKQNVSNLNLFDTLDFNGNAITSFMYDNEGGMYTTINGEKVSVFDNKKSVLPLKLGYQMDYSKIRLDESRTQGSMVDPYLSQIWIKSRDFFALVNKGFTMQYVHIAFMLSGGNPVMQLSVVYQYRTGLYSLLWHYDYVRNEDGTITYSNRKQFNAGATRYEASLRSLVDYFCKVTYKVYNAYDPSKIVIDKVIPRTFVIDWAENNTEGLDERLGGFFPVDDPTCFCPGILMK
ncbi:MAG: DUF4302 domain-containing protein [Bacteroidales bacterium]